MNGFAPEPARARDSRALGSLENSFQTFNRVSRDLERVYTRLESRAAVVEERLAEGNKRLTEQVTDLSREVDELHGILESIPCGVVVCDQGGNVTRTNLAAQRILGRSSKELIGRNAGTLRGPGGQAVLLLGQEEDATGQTLERAVTTLDGSARFLSGSVAALPDEGHLEILTDQTEVAHLRSQINRLDTLAALGEMAAAVAHEIRNPMNGVQGFAGLLEKMLNSNDTVSKDQLLRYTDRIRRGVAEVNGIISNLLLWARPERAEFQTIQVAELVQEIRHDLRSNPSKAGAGCLELGMPSDSIVVRGDRLKLKLVIGNLVRNAFDAVSESGKVRVSATEEERTIRIRVDDDGPGVDPAVRARLFQPFTTTKANGTGLGLAIVRKLVDLHRGDITLDTSPLGGARFTVTLPAGVGRETT